MKIHSFTWLTLVLLTGTVQVRAAEEAKSPALDMNSFQIVAERNIFNPGRVQRIVEPRKILPSPDWFALTGTASYPVEGGRQMAAFFNGSSRQFHGSFKPSETIAGFKITGIANDFVSLMGPGNNIIQLRVDNQMRKPYQGTWGLMGATKQ